MQIVELIRDGEYHKALKMYVDRLDNPKYQVELEYARPHLKPIVSDLSERESVARHAATLKKKRRWKHDYAKHLPPIIQHRFACACEIQGLFLREPPNSNPGIVALSEWEIVSAKLAWLHGLATLDGVYNSVPLFWRLDCPNTMHRLQLFDGYHSAAQCADFFIRTMPMPYCLKIDHEHRWMVQTFIAICKRWARRRLELPNDGGIM